MPLDQSLALLCATPADGEAIPPNLALLACGALKYCHNCGVRGVLLGTELRELLGSITVCFICSSPVLLCLVLCQIAGVPVGQCCAQGGAGAQEFLVQRPLFFPHCS